MKINFKRLAWVVFIVLYAGLFFYNCLRPFDDWFVPYVYTMLLIVWLAREYYQKNFFFQSGLIPDALYFWLPRALFALFFYSALVFGIATVIWWPQYRIGVYPVTNIAGILLLAASVYLRRQAFDQKLPDRDKARRFYVSIVAMVFSMALGYGSFFLLAYVVLIGLPLVYWNYAHEQQALAGFAGFLQKQGTETIKQSEYTKHWDKYLASRVKKPKQK